MAEIILGILCLLAGVVCCFLALLVLWAGALERSATGSGGTGYWPLILALIGIAGLIAGQSLIF